MIRSFILLSVLALVVPSIAFAAAGVPMLRAVDKDEAMRGDTVTATGESLSKANVAELYLTDGKNDIKVKISEQTATSIKFLVGKDAGFGRYSLMILTAGETPMFIEQPVKLNVVEQYTPKPPVEEAPEAPVPSAPTETP